MNNLGGKIVDKIWYLGGGVLVVSWDRSHHSLLVWSFNVPNLDVISLVLRCFNRMAYMRPQNFIQLKAWN